MKPNSPKSSNRWRPRHVAVLVGIGVIGVAVSTAIILLVAAGENSQSVKAFDSVFGSQVQRFRDFLRVRILGARAIGDAFNVVTLDRSIDVTHKVLRVYGVVFSTFYGGVSILERIPNTPSAIAAWEANATSRWGYNVTVFDDGLNASVGQPFLWVITDGNSTTVTPLQALGRDITSRLEIREAIAEMDERIQANASISDPNSEADIPLFGNQLEVTGVFPFISGYLGFETITTVSPGDVSLLVMVTTTLDSFLQPALQNHRQDAIITIVDHTGAEFTSGGCTPAEKLSEIKGSVFIPAVPIQEWSIRIGECPAFRAQYTTWKRWWVVTAVLLSTLLAMEVFRRQLKKSWTDADIRQSRMEQQLYYTIVGYVCHEVRNPLHVLKSSFEGLHATLQSALRTAAEFRASSTFVTQFLEIVRNFLGDDANNTMEDGRNAITQMQATVNDVLDLQSMMHGKFGYSPVPTPLASAVMVVLRRCRRYLYDNVRYHYTLPNSDVVASIDMLRASQIITNALSNAGKFVSQGGLVHVEIRVIEGGRGNGYVVIRVTNTRQPSAVIRNTESLFVPFKSAFKTSSPANLRRGNWLGVSATAEHVRSMVDVVRSLDNRASQVPYEHGDIPADNTSTGNPVSTSTGLGLPLCRAFALAGGGWAAIDDTNDCTTMIEPHLVQGLNTAGTNGALGATQFWAVLRAHVTSALPVMEASSKLDDVISLTDVHNQLSPTNSSYRSRKSSSQAPLLRSPSMLTFAVNSSATIPPMGDSGMLPGVVVVEGIEGIDEIGRDSPTRTLSASPTAESHLLQSPGSDVVVVTCEAEDRVGEFSPLALSRLRVLFVDDEQPNRRIGKRVLTQLGIEPGNVTLLENGNELLEYLSNHHTVNADSGVDVIFLDIMMPGLTGIQVLEELGKRGCMPQCPVIATTGSIDQDMQSNMKQVGFVGCLAKPFTKQGASFALQSALSGAKWFLRLE